MATKEFDLGNVRGPQGPTGPQNTIITTKYAYQVGTSQTKQPTGEWTSTRPECPQGQYLWTRITHEFASGDPAVEYHCEYVARDATLQADQRLTQLEDKVEGINDLTTGINLLRGTRDFRIGEQRPTEENEKDRFTDGFTIVTPGYVEKYVDDEGFTCVKMARSGLTADAYSSIDSSVMTMIKAGDTITISFEFMIDDVSVFSSDRTQIMNANSMNYTIEELTGLRLSDLKSGVWYKAKKQITYTAVNGRKIIRLQLRMNGSINFRKLCANKGVVNNPIWSASPFDLASSYGWDIETPALLGNIRSRILPNGTDLDEMIECGTWAVNDGPANMQITNAPSGKSGKLYVDLTIGYSSNPTATNNKAQTYVTYDGDTYYRKLDNSTTKSWQPWRQTYNNAAIRPLVAGGTGSDVRYNAISNLMMPRDYQSKDEIYKGCPDTNTYINNNVSYALARFSGSPSDYDLPVFGHILTLHHSGQHHQIMFGDNGRDLYIRTTNDANQAAGTAWSPWAKIYNDSHTIGVANGGTGGKNATDAVNNLWSAIAAKIEATYNVTKK